MPSSKENARIFYNVFRAQMLSVGAPLFETGTPEDAKDDGAYIRRLNRHIAMKPPTINDKVPDTLAGSVSKKGSLNKHAELIVFGDWLLYQGMPGASARPGKKLDKRRFLKMVACALAAQQVHECNKKAGNGKNAVAPHFRLTSKVLTEQHDILFGERPLTRDFTAPLRSMAHLFPEYLSHLETGKLLWHGKVVTASSTIRKLAAAQKPTKPSRKPAIAIVTPATLSASDSSISRVPAVHVPSRFTIEPIYSVSAEELEYRGVGGTLPPLPILNYSITPVLPTSGSSRIRSDRKDRVVLSPVFDAPKRLRVRALIDRIVITFTTSNVIAATTLHKALTTSTGANVFVYDRSLIAASTKSRDASRDAWVAQLPELARLAPEGKHFAIQMQDPPPLALHAVIAAIKDGPGLEGVGRLFLLELAVDFYPRGANTPEEMLVGREEIVGLLQRHHWASHQLLVDVDAPKPKRFDARQVYSVALGQTKTRHLFAKTNGLSMSDSQVNEKGVQGRILSAGQGNHLYLNAHVYRGHRLGKIQTNAQHKIVDRRNKAKKSAVRLAPGECRGRVELTLTGFETLEAFGITALKDLSTGRFKGMAEKLIRFRLPTCENTTEDIAAAVSQLTHRGVYGVELSQRAAYLADRAGMNPKPRKFDREGWALVDWPEMNKAVGDALGRLRTEWKKF